MGAGRLRDLQRRLRDRPGLPDVSTRAHRLRRERLGGEDDHRRGSRAARESLAGARQDADARADRRHGRLRGAPAPEDRDDLGVAEAARAREPLRPQEHARRARRYDAPDRSGDDRVHVGHHRPAEGRDADPRQSRCRRGGLETVHPSAGRLGAPPVPAAGALVRAARVVPGRHARADHGVRGEPRQGGREPQGDPAPLHLQRAARVREGLRQDPRRRRSRLAREEEDLRLGRIGRPRRQPPSAARSARAHGARAQAKDRAQARLLQAPRGARRTTAVGRVGRRPALAGHRGVLPRRRHPLARGLRPHRDMPGAHVQSAGPLQVRLRRPEPSGSPAENRRGRGDPGARTQHRDLGLLQAARGHARGVRYGRLVPHGGHRRHRPGRLPRASPIARRT